MYDKVKLFCTAPPEIDFSQYLTDGVSQTDITTGEVSYHGSIDGLRVNAYPNGVSVIGSLTKYLHQGNNIYPLDRHTTREAIDKLSDALHVDMHRAKVTALEFGAVFLMQRPPQDYISQLGAMPRRERIQVTPHSLMYRRKGRLQPDTLAFYDKAADAQAKGMKMPKGLENANLLKYELRLDGRLSKQLHRDCVTAADLYDRQLYGDLMHRWATAYRQIDKQPKQAAPDFSQIKTVSAAYDAFVATLLTSSTSDQISAFIADLKAANAFTDRKYYSRLRAKIEQVAAHSRQSTTNALISELTDAVTNTIAYY